MMSPRYLQVGFAGISPYIVCSDYVRSIKGTIHNPSFATTPLSPGKIKKVPPKLINFTYTKVSLNI
jgi:hypothetical protein